MAIREARWDCGYCGTKGNRGRKRKCPHCGAVREKDVRFYLPSKEEAAVLDAALLVQASAGPDWYCEHCGSSNAGGLDACHRCAAPRGSSLRHPVTEHAIPPSDANASGATAKESAGPAPARPPQRAKKAGPGCLGCLAVLAITVLLVVGTGRLVEWARRRPRPFPATVVGLAWKHEVRTESRAPQLITGFSWERWISYERFERIRDSGPDVPEGARALREYEERGTERRCETRRVRTTKEVRETKRVVSHREETETESYQVQVGTRESTFTCGTIDLRNGFFEDKVCTRSEPVYETRTREQRRQVPVYEARASTRDVPGYRDEEHCVDEPTRETRYEYEYTGLRSRLEMTEGQDRNPRWARARPRPGERESGRDEWLYVLYADKGTGLPRTQRILDKAEWRRLKVGDPVPSLPESWGPGRLLTLESQSRDEREVRWPELARDEREAERKATYTVFLRGEDGKEYAAQVGNLAEWQRYTPGGPATVYLSQGRLVGAQSP